MSAPIRFLGFAIIAYVGLRTVGSALALEPMGQVSVPPPATPLLDQAAAAAAPALPPGAAADMGAMAAPPPPGYGYAAGYGYGYPPGFPGVMMMPPSVQAYPVPYPVVAAAMPAPRQSAAVVVPSYDSLPQPAPAFEYPQSLAAGSAGSSGYEGAVPPLDQWPAVGTAASALAGVPQVTPSWNSRRRGGGAVAQAGQALDAMAEAAGRRRISLDAWTLLRPPRQGLLSTTDPSRGLNPGVASAGALGGSQAGLRLTWRPTGRLGVHLRASTALMPQGRGGQAMAGGEAALGASWQPIGGLPIRLLGERRQRMGSALGGGRNAFVLMAEGGVYDRPLPYGIRLDGYGQAGVLGARSRDLFADGGLTATTGFMPRFAIGGGIWGGTQPGLYRLDAGPRLSYQLHPRMKVHLDYRFRAIGNADPVSGPALTLSGGF